MGIGGSNLPIGHKKRLEAGRRKIGVYLTDEMVEDLKQVGTDLHARGLGGNISDVLRLVLTVCKRKEMLDAAYLTRAASEFDSTLDLRRE
jgi:hypothetical protein